MYGNGLWVWNEIIDKVSIQYSTDILIATYKFSSTVVAPGYKQKPTHGGGGLGKYFTQ